MKPVNDPILYTTLNSLRLIRKAVNEVMRLERAVAANAAAQPPSAAYVRAVQRRNIAKSKLKGMVESI